MALAREHNAIKLRVNIVDKSLFCFNIYNMKQEEWHELRERRGILLRCYWIGISHVPLLILM